MSNENLTQPQFDTAEFQTAPDHCEYCNQPVGTTYYRVGPKMACVGCAERFKSEAPKEPSGAFMRALMFGSGAALLGLIIYSTVGIVTGFNIGYVSLAVGWIIGKAMKKGSGGFGGRKYQITAVLLTYAAVSVSAVPVAISMMIDQEKQVQATQVKSDASSEPQKQSSDTSSAPPKSDPVAPAQEAPMGFGLAIVTLLLVGLASPFLGLTEGISGVIGLVILFVGIQIAWSSTKAEELNVEGPFENSKTFAAGAGA